MATQNSIIPFTGRLGNLIGYQRNGKYFFRSMPEIVRQTVATRRAAHRFGMASRKAALIRNAFYNDLDVRCDSSHINRLNKMLIAAGSNYVAVKGFRFNQYAGIDRFLTISPEFSGDGILHIPAQTLMQYKDVTTLEVKVIAACLDFTTHEIIDTNAVLTTIDTRKPFTGADIELDVPDNGTLVVTLQVRAIHKDSLACNRQYLAADIIAVITPQTPKVFKEYTYLQRVILQRQLLLIPTYIHAYRPVIQRE